MNVVILAAGAGTRMGEYAGRIHKALLPVNGEAAISSIIRAYPEGTRFIIPIGPLGEQIEDYLTLAHPHDDWTLIDADGTPSDSPIVSLMTCEPLLGEEPFEFIACDTILLNGTNMTLKAASGYADWYGAAWRSDNTGYDEIDYRLSSDPTIFRVARGIGSSRPVFTGRARISSPKNFFDCAREIEDRNLPAVLTRYAERYRVMVGHHAWLDIGTIKRYRKATSKENFIKDGEFRYEIDGMVIKWFEDETITANRVKKAQANQHLYPTMIGRAGQFYAYEWVPGKTLYRCATPEIFAQFLQFMKDNVWRNDGPLDHRLVDEFYNKKTKKRLGKHHPPPTINDIPINRFKSIGNHVGIRSPIHGDLQFANIIYDGSKFTLIDWRQDFAGEVEYGDLYYDFAKLLGGMMVNYDFIGAVVKFFHGPKDVVAPCLWAPKKGSTREMVAQLKQTAEEMGLDWTRVIDITGIIYLNMSGIHDNDSLKQYLMRMGYLVLSRHDKTKIFDF